MLKFNTFKWQLNGLTRLCSRRTLSVSPRSFGLSDQLTPEFKKSLAGEATRQKFKVERISRKLEALEQSEFPLPEKLTEEQWKMLMSFENVEGAIWYVNKVAELGDEITDKDIEEIREMDAKLFGQLVLDEKDVEEIVGNDPEKLKTVEQIKHIHENFLMEGYRLAPHIPRIHFEEMIAQKGSKRIAKTFLYLHTLQRGNFSDWVDKKIRIEKGKELKRQYNEKVANEKHITYGLGHNTTILRVSRKKMERQDDFKVVNGYHSWGQPLVIDLSFVKTLSLHYVKSLFYREVAMALKYNRERADPFGIYFTSFDPNCSKCAYLEKAIPRIFKDPAFPAIVTEKSYMDMFPQEQLLYLSPDSRNDYLEYNPNDVFIIGAIVDVDSKSYKSLASAKKNEIRHARFPSKRVIGMQVELTVDAAVAVLAEYKNSRDWLHAFRWVPPRKFRNRLKVGSYTKENEAVYHAHSALSPTTHDLYKFERMGPIEYRQEYKRLVEKFKRENAHRPDVMVNDDQYHQKTNEEKRQKISALLESL